MGETMKLTAYDLKEIESMIFDLEFPEKPDCDTIEVTIGEDIYYYVAEEDFGLWRYVTA